MATVRLKFPSDVPKAIRDTVSREVIQRGFVRAAYRGQALLRKRTPVDQGLMKNAWQVRGWGGQLELVNTAPYAGVIEGGARPHPVSRAGQMAIYWWVVRHRKLFATLRTKKGNAVRLRHGKPGTEQLDSRVLSMVYAITKKIREKGQRPTYFIKHSLPELDRYVGVEVNRSIAEHNKGGG